MADEPFFRVRSVAGSFEHGAVVSPHTHTWNQLIYATQGVVTVRTDHGTWVVPPNLAVWVPADQRHALEFTGRTVLRTLYVRADLPPAVERSVVIGVSPLLRELIVRAVSLGMLDERVAAHAAIAQLILLELHQHPAAPLDLPEPRGDTLRRVAALIVSEEGTHTHATLARRFGVSVRTLERGFLRETGMSLGRWRRQARFQRALQLLGAGGSVKQAAVEAGYRSPSAFIAAFRSALRMTPARYFSPVRRANEWSPKA